MKNIVPENRHSEENGRIPRETVFGKLKHHWRKLVFEVTSKIPKNEALHPDFRLTWSIENITWHQNRTWDAGDPKYKIGFYFNNTSVLDNCPWVGKFGNNVNAKFPEYEYFFVGYGDPQKWKDEFGIEEMKEWAKQFDHPSLMTYNGQLIEMLK